jgi:hypothetical protein
LGREACEGGEVSIAAEASKIAALPGSNVSLAGLHELILKRAASMTTNEVIRYPLKQGADITMVSGIHIIRSLDEENKWPQQVQELLEIPISYGWYINTLSDRPKGTIAGYT